MAAAFALGTRAALADTAGLVRGTVTLAGKPAAGVTITLTLAGEAPHVHATTDASGAFSLAQVPFGRYTLVAHKDGVPDFTQTVEVATGSIVTLPIELQLRTIGKATVTVGRGVASAPVSVNSITRAQLSALPQNQSLNQVITTFPGVVRFSYNEPVAHGFHGLAYELDGVPLPIATTSNFGEIIDPRTIDSLEVFTGAFPAEFGGSRQGAVINIISHRQNDLETPESGSVTAGLGSYGSAQTSFAESLTLGRTRLFLKYESRAHEPRHRLAYLRSHSRQLESVQPIPAHDHERRCPRHAGLRRVQQRQRVPDSDQHESGQPKRPAHRSVRNQRRAARVRQLLQRRVYE